MLSKTYGFDGAHINKVFSCNGSAPVYVGMLPVILPGFFRFSRKSSPGCACPPEG